ncbi:MAG: hypothetical protein DMD91_32030 [Candidatus Rokuibacteriota bacterium]|nr:MAG: hypothetical protein DMD91_32030 [Candidatus Rokubacteria bacterium]
MVDADGHVLEPADTWLKYLDPEYRDRAIRIDRDEHGYEVLLIDGQPLKTLRGQLGALGGIDMDTAKLLTRGQITAQMVEHLGADYFVWASDYPHIDASFGVVRELKERLAPLPEEARRKVLGLNARRFYRLAV